MLNFHVDVRDAGRLTLRHTIENACLLDRIVAAIKHVFGRPLVIAECTIDPRSFETIKDAMTSAELSRAGSISRKP